MILPGHPDFVSDQEVSGWMHRPVTQKESESIFPDYRETIQTRSLSEKCQIAKEISPFANERGGIVLYGIPEQGENSEPVPPDVDDIGMAPVPSPSQVTEGILIGAPTPGLPVRCDCPVSLRDSLQRNEAVCDGYTRR